MPPCTIRSLDKLHSLMQAEAGRKQTNNVKINDQHNRGKWNVKEWQTHCGTTKWAEGSVPPKILHWPQKDWPAALEVMLAIAPPTRQFFSLPLPPAHFVTHLSPTFSTIRSHSVSPATSRQVELPKVLRDANWVNGFKDATYNIKLQLAFDYQDTALHFDNTGCDTWMKLLAGGVLVATWSLADAKRFDH